MPQTADYRAWVAAANQLMLNREAKVADLDAAMLCDAVERLTSVSVNTANRLLDLQKRVAVMVGLPEDADNTELMEAVMNSDDATQDLVAPLLEEIATAAQPMMAVAPVFADLSMWMMSVQRQGVTPTADQSVVKVAETAPIAAQLAPGAPKVKTFARYTQTDAGITVESFRLDDDGTTAPMAGAVLLPATAPLGRSLTKLFNFASQAWRSEIAGQENQLSL